MSEELKPCPCCHRTASVRACTDDNGELTNGYHCFCNGCTEGPWGETKEEAIKLWNTRPIENVLKAELASKDEKIVRLNEFIKTSADAVKKTLDPAKALIIHQGEEIKALEEWAEAERHLRMEQSDADPQWYSELALRVHHARRKVAQIRQGNKLRAHCEGKPVINNEDDIGMPGMAED